jgi:DUF1680 family protein
MNNRKKLVIGVVVALGLLGQAALPAADDLTARFELTLNRVLRGGLPFYTDDLVLADAVPLHVRRFTEFSGDVSGRYIGALAVAEQFSGKDFPELDRVAGKLVTLQKADGHFGDPFSTNDVTTSDMALLWGNGRLLVGLLEYHAVKPSPEVLACARRLGDCFVNFGPRFNDPEVVRKFSGDQKAVGYICWTQIIEGLVALNRATSDERYLRLAEEIATNTHRVPKQHSHGFVSSVRGILELYRVTHAAKWLQKVETEWDGILSSGNLLPQGALPEIFKPGTVNDEGCSEADWLRLNLGLWAETRNPRYLENAELTLFNEFALNQFHTGDFGHHILTGTGIGDSYAHAWWCCTLHGLRAFPDVFHAAFHAEPACLCYDLPVEGRGAIRGLIVQADSSLEQNATVTLTVTESDGRELALRLRQPGWASALELELNHRPLTGNTTADGLEIRRAWKHGDTLTIHYPLRTRLVADSQNAGRVAIVRGPWFLGVNNQQTPTFFDEPFDQNRILLPARNGNNEVQFEMIAEKSKAAPFTVPVAHLLLNYLPGGYPVQRQTVILCPIAEHTAMARNGSWVFWFTPAEKPAEEQRVFPPKIRK